MVFHLPGLCRPFSQIRKTWVSVLLGIKRYSKFYTLKVFPQRRLNFLDGKLWAWEAALWTAGIYMRTRKKATHPIFFLMFWLLTTPCGGPNTTCQKTPKLLSLLVNGWIFLDMPRHLVIRSRLYFFAFKWGILAFWLLGRSLSAQLWNNPPKKPKRYVFLRICEPLKWYPMRHSDIKDTKKNSLESFFKNVYVILKAWSIVWPKYRSQN